MRNKLFLVLLIAALLPTYLGAIEMDYSIGTRIGVGISSSATNNFIPIDPATGQRQDPLASRPQGKLANHVIGSFMIYGDIGFVDWFAITPEVLFSFGHKTVIGDADSQPLGLLKAPLMFMTIDIDILAKFRWQWLYFGIGPGVSIATPPFFPEKSPHPDYKTMTKMRVDFIMAADIGLNVPLGQTKRHHLTFNTRASVNISGMVGLHNSTKRWNKNELTSKDENIYGINAVSGTFYVGYMYKF